jgi:hypothetical protein
MSERPHVPGSTVNGKPPLLLREQNKIILLSTTSSHCFSTITLQVAAVIAITRMLSSCVLGSPLAVNSRPVPDSIVRPTSLVAGCLGCCYTAIARSRAAAIGTGVARARGPLARPGPLVLQYVARAATRFHRRFKEKDYRKQTWRNGSTGGDAGGRRAETWHRRPAGLSPRLSAAGCQDRPHLDDK